MPLCKYHWGRLPVGGTIRLRWQIAGFASALTCRQTLLRSAAYFRERKLPGYRVKTMQEHDFIVAERVA